MSVGVLTLSQVKLDSPVAWRVATLAFTELGQLTKCLFGGRTRLHLPSCHRSVGLRGAGQCNLVLVRIVGLDWFIF